MSITADYDKALNDAAVVALRNVVANHPRTSVADLRELVSAHAVLGDVTLAELLGSAKGPKREGAKPKGPKPKSLKPQAAKPNAAPAAAPVAARQGKKRAGKRTKSRDGWDTRTDEGRAALDQAVIEALAVFGGIAVSAEAISARIGATPAQLRSAMSRHVETGAVSVSGKARGTRYSLE